MDSSATEPTTDTAALVDRMRDPITRLYRARLAQLFVPRTAGGAYGVACGRAAMGLLAAACVAEGSDRALLAAVVASELGLVLDAVVHARAHGARAVADCAAYLAMCAALFVHLRARDPELPAGTLLVAMMLVSGVMGWVHDYYSRKLGGALACGTDDVCDELRAKHEGLGASGGGVAARFAFWFDWLQVVVLQSGTRREIEGRVAGAALQGDGGGVEVRYVLKNAHSKGMRFVLGAIGAIARENVFTILAVGFVLGNVALAETVVITYGIFAMAGCILVTNLFLHGSRRPLTRVSLPPAE